MFIYEFEAGNACLITKIVISGSHLVLYANRKNSQELNFMVRKFNLGSNVSGDHPAHVFSHNAHVDFSAKGDILPHKHLKFPSDVDRLSCLKDMFKFLLDRQSNPSLRNQDYETLINALDQERISRGDKIFPEDVQDALDDYDLQIPYLPENEVETVLRAFNAYASSDINRSLEAVSAYAEEILHKNWGIIYDKMIYGEHLSDDEKILYQYYNNLKDLRYMLLGMNSNHALRFEFLQHAIDIIDAIMKNKNYPMNSSFSQHLYYINDRMSNEYNSTVTQQFLKSGILLSVFTIGFFLWKGDTPIKAIISGILAAATATTVTKYTVKPLSYAINHLFYKAEPDMDNNKNDQTVRPTKLFALNYSN